MTVAMAGKFRTFALAPALVAAVAVTHPREARAQPVVQAVPPAALGDLQAALRVLSRDPEDFRALLRAGTASLDLDDPQAALGFFRRAQALRPASAEVTAGFASIALREGNAIEAVRLFAQAEAGGAPMAPYAGDRGLALDLVGSNLAAQRHYREALRLGDDPEIVRRLALSQAIAGDRSGSEATLLPLLQRSDLAAYRTRAFALAILGRSEEAVSVARTMLPAALSNRMAPYLRYMPRLTRAQQAAAANLGRFPAAGEIGRDSPEIAALSGQGAPPQVAVRTPDSRLEPAGRPLGASPEAAQRTRERRSRDRARQNGVVVGRVAEVVATPIEPPPAATQPAPPQSGPEARPAVVVAAEPATVIDSPPQAETGNPRPSLSIAQPSAVPPRPLGDAPEAAPLAELFADFSLPPGGAARPAAGAVDITTIDPPRAKPPQAEPEPPAHPRRYWVQVATGRDLDALAWDWRRIKRSGGELLSDKDAFTAPWGQANRLVVGPYPSARAAQQAVGELKAKGLDTFAFTSAEGEAVSPLR